MQETYQHAIDLLLSAQRRTPQPREIFSTLDQVMGEEIGHRLFTVLRQHRHPRELERLYTNQPQAYPFSGRKVIVPSRWTSEVLDHGNPYIGYTAADIRDAFPDHETITALGCASVLNIPLVYEGVVLGSVNLLHEEGYYGEAHVNTARLLASFALPALLA
ncbi:GAF domain-containing protein [Alphaproteobacteria bacterium LSUCC0684]